MPVFGSFDAWITVADERLTEYDVQEETLGTGTTQLTCWTPSTAGSDFAIHVKDKRNEDRPATISRMWADGTWLSGRIIGSSSGVHSSAKNDACLSNVSTSEGRKCLAFADVKLTDDDELLHKATSAQLGELKIVIQEIEMLKAYEPGQRDPQIIMSDGTMHERSKKAGVHNVQLGSPSVALAPTTWDTKNIGQPVVEFIFRYRPLEILRANGIAPLPTPRSHISSRHGTHSPPDAPDDETDIQATHDEIRELEERLTVLKRKRDTKEEPGIKIEPGLPANRRRISRTTIIETIDLTLDDD